MNTRWRRSVIHQHVLECRTAQQRYGRRELLLDAPPKVARERGHIAIGNKGGEIFARFARHLFVDALQTLHQHARVVSAVAVRPHIGNNFGNRARGAGRRVFRNIGSITEISQQRPVETVENHEMRFVGILLALARAAPHHLRKQDARPHGPQEHNVFQVGNVHARGEHIHRHHDAGTGPIPEFADRLQRTVHRCAARDLADERIAAPEDLARQIHKLIGVRSVSQVVNRKDQRFGKTAVLQFMFQRIGLDLFQDAAIGVR
jgi:hypothetical protein